MEKEIVDIIKKVKITKRSKTLILDCPFGKDQVVYDLRDSELPASKEAGFRRRHSKDTGFEPAGSLFSCLSG